MYVFPELRITISASTRKSCKVTRSVYVQVLHNLGEIGGMICAQNGTNDHFLQR